MPTKFLRCWLASGFALGLALALCIPTALAAGFEDAEHFFALELPEGWSVERPEDPLSWRRLVSSSPDKHQALMVFATSATGEIDALELADGLQEDFELGDPISDRELDFPAVGGPVIERRYPANDTDMFAHALYAADGPWGFVVLGFSDTQDSPDIAGALASFRTTVPMGEIFANKTQGCRNMGAGLSGGPALALLWWPMVLVCFLLVFVDGVRYRWLGWVRLVGMAITWNGIPLIGAVPLAAAVGAGLVLWAHSGAWIASSLALVGLAVLGVRVILDTDRRRDTVRTANEAVDAMGNAELEEALVLARKAHGLLPDLDTTLVMVQALAAHEDFDEALALGERWVDARRWKKPPSELEKYRSLVLAALLGPALVQKRRELFDAWLAHPDLRLSGDEREKWKTLAERVLDA